MRISTNQFYSQGVAGIDANLAKLLNTQRQLSSGKRILDPSDDPGGAAQVLDLTQAQSLNAQYIKNSGFAKDNLTLEESTLASVTSELQDLKTQAINAGSGSLSTSDLASISSSLRSRFQDLLGLANTKDGSGQYLFSGYQNSTKPFSEASPGNVTYSGDQGQRFAQISAGRQIGISDSGYDIFQKIKNGNGTFVTAAGASNTGNATISQGGVVNTSALTNDNYTITFAVTNGVTTYSVVNTTTSTNVISNAAYTSDSNITFDGIQVAVKNAPADTDTFTVAPSTNTSIFTTINNLATALTSTDPTKRQQGIDAGLANLSNALDNVLTVRASTGSRLQEIDSTTSTAADTDLNYSTAISNIQDVDYNKAITDLTLQTTYLQAAQQSFAKVQGLSLFNYIR